MTAFHAFPGLLQANGLWDGAQTETRDIARDVIPFPERQRIERQFIGAQLSHSVSEPICSGRWGVGGWCVWRRRRVLPVHACTLLYRGKSFGEKRCGFWQQWKWKHSEGEWKRCEIEQMCCKIVQQGEKHRKDRRKKDWEWGEMAWRRRRKKQERGQVFRSAGSFQLKTGSTGGGSACQQTLIKIFFFYPRKGVRMQMIR